MLLLCAASTVPQVPSYVAAGEVLALLEDEPLPQAFKVATTTSQHDLHSSSLILLLQCPLLPCAAVQKLVTEGFLGAPVVNSDHRFVAFVDMLDLVYYVTNMFTECQRPQHRRAQSLRFPSVAPLPSSLCCRASGSGGREGRVLRAQ